MITHLHVKSGDDSLKIGCGGHHVFQKLLKINTSQAIGTLYLYK